MGLKDIRGAKIARYQTHLVHVLELLVPGPILLGGRAQHLKDLLDLLDLRLPVEEHLLGQELRHDAAK